MKKKIYKYQVNYEIILNGVEPFTNSGSKIRIFLDDLYKHNLISSHSWNIIDDIVIKHKKLKAIIKGFKRIYRYFKEKKGVD